MHTFQDKNSSEGGFLGRNHQQKVDRKTNSMNPTAIEFHTPSTVPDAASVSPWLPPAKRYQDLILKPEFASRRFKFPTGTTWFRVVPALRDSNKGWMLGVHALQYPGGRHAHPRTITPVAKSVFDHAYGWCKDHKPEALYSKTNKATDAYRLLADPFCLLWMLTEIDGKPVARLLLESGYDGSRGGTPGLGHQIWKLSQEKDEEGNRIGNPADPKVGAQICVEKKQGAGTRYSSYTAKMGRVAAPIDDMIAKMDPQEIAALTKLEQVVHLPSEEEEWKLLEQVIDAKTVEMIRDSVG
jgi:hypothetical protein